MKNTIKVFGNLNRAQRAKVPLLIIAIVAMIGFTMAACDDGTETEVSDSFTGGRLTITGLSDYNGQFLEASHSANKIVVTSSNDNMAFSGLTINAGCVTFYAWNYTGAAKKSYKGNDKNVAYNVYIFGDNPVRGTVKVNFTNGLGTGAFVPNP
jgi:hypothetical protein